jgi:hypothetical protein
MEQWFRQFVQEHVVEICTDQSPYIRTYMAVFVFISFSLDGLAHE